MAKPNAPTTPETFETAMERLEKIVQAMDSPTLPLDDLIKHYEEGTVLVKVCEEKLKEAERKIEIITRTSQGQPELAEFDPDAKSSEGKTPAGPRKDINLF